MLKYEEKNLWCAECSDLDSHELGESMNSGRKGIHKNFFLLI